VTESLGDPTDDDVIDTVIDVQSHINSFVEQQKEVLEKDQPVLMEKEDLTPILENSGIEEPIANQIVEKCNSFFEEDFPTAEDILDTKVLKDNSLRMEKNELQEQVVELHHKLREAGITDEEGNEVSVIVKVPDDKEAEVTATFVDGRRCLVIPLDGNEETTINGKHKIF
jgi:RecA/RadA recombinase